MSAAAVLALTGSLVASTAQAGIVAPFTIGPPNAAVVPGADADQQLEDPEGNVKELGPLNSNTTKIGVIHNDVVPTLGLTNPNGQVDLRQAWLGTESDADGDDWLYFGWERDNETGSGFIAFEFMADPPPDACGDYTDPQADLIASCNPWANRQADDFMILWDQQGGSKDLYLLTWSGTAPNLVLSAPQLLNSNVSDAEYSADGFFGEGALNLTDTVFGGSDACRSFANVIPSTVTGNSNTADYKDTILQPVTPIGNCETTTVTTPQGSTGASIPAGGVSITTAGAVEVKDSAVIDIADGTAVPAGTIDFSLCMASNAANATCDVNGPSLLVDDDKAVSDADGAYPVTVVSSSAWITSAGRYCWQATYGGDPDSGISGSSDVSIGECFVVSPVTPTVSTTAGPDVYLGQSVTDTAALGGTAPQPTADVIHTSAPDPATRTAANGTITFQLYGPADMGCGDLVYDSSMTTPSEDASVAGDGNYSSASFTPTAPGNYHWVAVYSGDSPNTLGKTHNADCTDVAEDVTVQTVTPTVDTAQKWVPNDDATITATAGGDLTGSVSFTLYPSTNCTGTPVFPTQTVAIPASAGLSETVSTSNTVAITATGDFSWSVSYDSTNPAQEDVAASCTEVSNLTIDNSYVQTP